MEDPKGHAMATRLDALMETLRSIEAEIEAELTRRREELRFRIENRKVIFEQDVRRIHRAIKVRATRYFIEANPLVVLSAGDLLADRADRARRYLGDDLSGGLFSDL
jgi:hypothetical protein